MIQTSNFARGIKVRYRILNKKCKTGHNGVWPRSHASSSRDLLNVQATDALKMVNGNFTSFGSWRDELLKMVEHKPILSAAKM